mgnify:CR=1 FL=1
MEFIAISKVRPNSDNPRYIKEEKFKKLVQSLKDFPEMANARPIVVNKEMVALGGNMRLKAMQEAGWTEVPVKVVEWSEEKQREFIIKDNVSFGDWDWDVLANQWEDSHLKDWGIEVWQAEDADKFEPKLIPETTYSDMTKKESQKEAQKLAIQMLKQTKGKECICPSCGEEFEIYE